MGLQDILRHNEVINIPQSPALYLVILLVLFTTYQVYNYDSRLKNLPPGPKGYPLIGNMLSLADPNKVPQIARSWAKEYGKIVHTKIGGSHFIWLNSPTVVKDLMDRRGSKYSSRPYAPMIDNVSGEARPFFMPYGERWRNVRKVSHALLNLKTSSTYKPVQDFESKQVMHNFLTNTDPWKFYDDNRRYAASVIMVVTYGRRIASWDDPHIKKIFTVLEHFVAMASPGAWFVDAFPFLRHLPSILVQNWWNIGREWFAFDSKVYLELYRNLAKQVDEDTSPDCFVKDFYLGNQEKNEIDELTAAYTCGSLVEAGSESTSTVINTWIKACLLYPHTIKAAQEEIDRVVGPGRLPTFEDEPNMPYVRAMGKEILRWKPITKFGTPHAVSEDDWYEGYFIPKNSVVMLSWWAIHFDPEIYANPEDYEPMRFINDPHSTAEALNLTDPKERDHYTYGAGRRVCPGVHVAQNSIFINMARTLWAFNLKRATDPKTGKAIELDTSTENGFLGIPTRFPCVFEPRSPEKAAIVEREWRDAESEGLQWARTKARI